MGSRLVRFSQIGHVYYLALATDYDGTLASRGAVDDSTLQALQRLRGSGRLAILVTGRTIPSLARVFPHAEQFDMVVAENGALLWEPDTKQEHVLAPAPPPELLVALRERKVEPLGVGRAIVATNDTHMSAVLDVIHDLGLEYQMVFNKGALMVLPSGVNKASGLEKALRMLQIPTDRCVAVGDAENDHAMLNLCGFSAAVANALPALKDQADYVAGADHGAGVAEVVDLLLSRDLRGLKRHRRGTPRAVIAQVKRLGSDTDVVPRE